MQSGNTKPTNITGMLGICLPLFEVMSHLLVLQLGSRRERTVIMLVVAISMICAETL